MNKVFLVGRLTKDPEFKSLQSGKEVATFSVATDESYKDKSGTLVKKATFHNIVAFNSINMIKYLHRGDQIILEGSISDRSYEDKQGVKKYVTEIILKSAEFGAKGKSEEVQKKDEEELPIIDDLDDINTDNIPF